MPKATLPNPEFIGKKYDCWTVISIKPTGKYNEKYLCKCICGLEKYFYSVNYMSGACRSCRSNLSRKYSHLKKGYVFGHWTLTGNIMPGGKSGIEQKYECRCRCGAISFVRGSHLAKKLSTGCRSCGAKRKSKRSIAQTDANISRMIANERLPRKIIP